MPPPRKVFEGGHRVGVTTAYNLGGDGDGLKIGGMDANKRNGRAVFVNFEDEAFRHKRAESCFRGSLNEWK